MNGFEYVRRTHRFAATIGGFEADLLRSLAGQMIELVRSESALGDRPQDPLDRMMDFRGPTTAPEDEVLARLFPDAYREDDEAAGEFRRFTELGLRDRKASNAAAVVDALDDAGLPDEPDEGITIDIELEHPDAMIWVTALNDIRLALGTRLGIDHDDEEEWLGLADDDPSKHMYAIYLWLTEFQYSLVKSLGRAVAHA